MPRRDPIAEALEAVHRWRGVAWFAKLSPGQDVAVRAAIAAVEANAEADRKATIAKDPT